MFQILLILTSESMVSMSSEEFEFSILETIVAEPCVRPLVMKIVGLLVGY